MLASIIRTPENSILLLDNDIIFSVKYLICRKTKSKFKLEKKVKDKVKKIPLFRENEKTV